MAGEHLQVVGRPAQRLSPTTAGHVQGRARAGQASAVLSSHGQERMRSTEAPGSFPVLPRVLLGDPQTPDSPFWPQERSTQYICTVSHKLWPHTQLDLAWARAITCWATVTQAWLSGHVSSRSGCDVPGGQVRTGSETRRSVSVLWRSDFCGRNCTRQGLGGYPQEPQGREPGAEKGSPSCQGQWPAAAGFPCTGHRLRCACGFGWDPLPFSSVPGWAQTHTCGERARERGWEVGSSEPSVFPLKRGTTSVQGGGQSPGRVGLGWKTTPVRGAKRRLGAQLPPNLGRAGVHLSSTDPTGGAEARPVRPVHPQSRDGDPGGCQVGTSLESPLRLKKPRASCGHHHGEALRGSTARGLSRAPPTPMEPCWRSNWGHLSSPHPDRQRGAHPPAHPATSCHPPLSDTAQSRLRTGGLPLLRLSPLPATPAALRVRQP